MSLSPSSSSEPPSNHKAKGNQRRPWLNKGQEYFEICNIQSDKEKVKYASIHMEGYAYNWYLWWKRDNFTYTWNLFKNNFFNRFQGIKEDDFFSKLTRLQQVGSVEEFTHQWECLSTEYLGCLTNKDSEPI